MKKFFFFTVFLFVLALPLRMANACGFGIYAFGEDYRTAFLNPYVAGDGYSAFFYSSRWLNHSDNDKNGSDRNRNCEEWAGRIGNGVTSIEVMEFLYRTSLDEVSNAISEGTENERFGENNFFKTLLNKENREVLDYLVFAKKYEDLSKNEKRNPWRSGMQPDRSGFEEEQLQISMQAAMEKAQGPWLTCRYAYQLMLMKRYAGQRSDFHAMYDAHFKNGRSTVLNDWALHHKAAMVDDPAERAYLYALSFDRCPEKNVASYQNFKKSQLEAALAFTKNDSERAALLALFEIKNPGRSLANIKKTTALDPSNRSLPLLLVREVNKLEDWLLTHQLTDGEPTVYVNSNDEPQWDWPEDRWDEYRRINQQKDWQHLLSLRGFLQKQIKRKGMDNDLLNLLVAHLLSMEQDPAAVKHLRAISGGCSPAIKQQKVTEELLLLLNQEDIIKSATQQKMTTLLTTLKAIFKDQPNGDRDFEMLHLLIKEAYLKKGHSLYAYCFHSHALHLPSKDNTYSSEYYALINFLDWRATEKDIDDLVTLLDKRDKTPFEQYLTSTHFPSRNALCGLRGTISFRKNNLPQALAAFSKVDAGFWKTKYEFDTHLDSDPFAFWQDSLTRGKFPETKTAFVRRLSDLEKETEMNPSKAAENYMALGTAWFNCSRMGKSWMMFCYGQSSKDSPESVDHYSYLPDTKRLQDVYFKGQRAIGYLNKAKAKGDKEIAAKADFLIARINALSYELTPAEQERLDNLPWNERRKLNPS